jgi:hypothetical protein
MKTIEESLSELSFDVKLTNYPHSYGLLTFDTTVGSVSTLLPEGFPAASPAYFMVSEKQEASFPRIKCDGGSRLAIPILRRGWPINDMVTMAFRPTKWNPNRDNAHTWVRMIKNALTDATDMAVDIE